MPLLDADPDGEPRCRRGEAGRHGQPFSRRGRLGLQDLCPFGAFSQQDAAALLAAMWKTSQQREATGSIAKLR